MKNLPQKCPSCGNTLIIHSLNCNHCGTMVTGSYPLPVLMQLAPDELDFILEFVKCSGNIKIMAEKMKLSYPTVRNYLDGIIEKLSHE